MTKPRPCPHCDAPVHIEYGDYHQQVQPAICDNGCHEFFDSSDCLTATDEEAVCGWWRGEHITESNVKVTEADRERLKSSRRVAQKWQDAKDAEAEILLDRLDRQKRYRDEALF